MQTKAIKDLRPGDTVKVIEPDGLAKVTKVGPGMFDGGRSVELIRIDGPSEGKEIFHIGEAAEDVVEIA